MRQYFASISNIVSAVQFTFSMFSPVSEFLYKFKKRNISTTLCSGNLIILTMIDYAATPKNIPCDAVDNIDQHFYITNFGLFYWYFLIPSNILSQVTFTEYSQRWRTIQIKCWNKLTNNTHQHIWYVSVLQNTNSVFYFIRDLKWSIYFFSLLKQEFFNIFVD